MNKHRELHPDAALIDELGGPAKLAELLKYDKASGGVQRIQNWKTRGIPASVKLEFPEIFLIGLIDKAQATDDTQPPVGISKPGPGRKKSGGRNGRKVKEARAV